MTREEMIKHKWKAYEQVWFYPSRGYECAIPCMVAEIDFDDESMTLSPIDEIHSKADISVGIKRIHFKNPTPDKIVELKKV